MTSNFFLHPCDHDEGRTLNGKLHVTAGVRSRGKAGLC
jgi:hypothetical protein